MKMFLRRHSLGIQARLTMLALVTALPLVALASFAILRTVDDQRGQAQRDVNERVDGLLADLDRQINAIQAEMQTSWEQDRGPRSARELPRQSGIIGDRTCMQ